MGAPICPSCNKFCGLETDEPEIDQYDMGVEDGTKDSPTTINVTGNIHLMRRSSCCGEDVREMYFDAEGDFTVKGHVGEGHELSLDEGDIEMLEEAGSRYQKSYYGYIWHPVLTCSCGQDVETEEELVLSDKAAASEFENLN